MITAFDSRARRYSEAEATAIRAYPLGGWGAHFRSANALDGDGDLGILLDLVSETLKMLAQQLVCPKPVSVPSVGVPRDGADAWNTRGSSPTPES